MILLLKASCKSGLLSALGYSGVDFDPEKVVLYFESKAGQMLINFCM